VLDRGEDRILVTEWTTGISWPSERRWRSETPSASAASLRERASRSFILIHNHPSGDSKPSEEDRAVTKRLKEAGDLLGFRLLDHVVFGAEIFHSFAEAGEL